MDPSPGVRQLAEFLLTDTLATKAPLLAYNHFVEALFVLNGCAAGLHGARLGASMGSGGNASEGQAAGSQGNATVQFTLIGVANRYTRDQSVWQDAPCCWLLKDSCDSPLGRATSAALLYLASEVCMQVHVAAGLFQPVSFYVEKPSNLFLIGVLLQGPS